MKNEIYVSAPDSKYYTIGYWYKTLGGFFRAYSFVAHLGVGPFKTKHDAIQFIINES